MNVCLKKDEDDSFYFLVTIHVTTHNHALNSDLYKAYHEKRICLNKKQLDRVDLLRRHGVCRKLLQQYILQSTPSSPTMKDVHNLMTKLKSTQDAGSTPESRLNAYMMEFCAESTGNIGRIFVNDEVISDMS
jgi:hypothetical protein